MPTTLSRAAKISSNRIYDYKTAILMNIENIVNNLFRTQNQFLKSIKKIPLTNDSLQQPIIQRSIQLFNSKLHSQKQFINYLMQQINENSNSAKTIKLIAVILQIYKLSVYDLADIIMNKKIKTFLKPKSIKPHEKPLNKNNINKHINNYLLIPLYNYLMKLSSNDELYNTFSKKIIPYDEIFRRGTKIRFIWIFKSYNLLHCILPIVNSLTDFITSFEKSLFFVELATFLYKDLLLINNYILIAIQQTAQDSYALMPYLDMMQFYESLKEQQRIQPIIRQLYKFLTFYAKVDEPKQLEITAQELKQIEIQALRISLISNCLKNPTKDHTRLQTQYNEKQMGSKQLYYTRNHTQSHETDQQEIKLDKYNHVV